MENLRELNSLLEDWKKALKTAALDTLIIGGATVGSVAGLMAARKFGKKVGKKLGDKIRQKREERWKKNYKPSRFETHEYPDTPDGRLAKKIMDYQADCGSYPEETIDSAWESLVQEDDYLYSDLWPLDENGKPVPSEALFPDGAFMDPAWANIMNKFGLFDTPKSKNSPLTVLGRAIKEIEKTGEASKDLAQSMVDAVYRLNKIYTFEVPKLPFKTMQKNGAKPFIDFMMKWAKMAEEEIKNMK